MFKQLRARLERLKHVIQYAPGQALVRELCVYSPSGRGVEIYTAPAFQTGARYILEGNEVSEAEHRVAVSLELAAGRARQDAEEDDNTNEDEHMVNVR